MPSGDLLEQLRRFDTPTVCNALERVAPQRRGQGYTTHPLICAHAHLPPIVGYARTATIRASQPSDRDAAAGQKVLLDYYRHVAEGPHPTVTVIQDIDPQPGYGAWWGEVNTHVHRGLGSIGVITNGSIRDLDQVAEGFQLLAGSVGPSHAWVRPVDCSLPVTVAGMEVRPGDLIHADRHGAVVIPADAADRLPAAAEEIMRGESVLIEASKRSDFSIGVLERIMSGGSAAH